MLIDFSKSDHHASLFEIYLFQTKYFGSWLCELFSNYRNIFSINAFFSLQAHKISFDDRVLGALIKSTCNSYHFDKWLLKEIFSATCHIIYVVLYKIYKTGIGTSSIATTKRYTIDRYNILNIYWSHLSEIHNRSVYIHVVIYTIISYNRYIYKLLVWSFLWYLPQTAWCAILELEW